MHSIVQGILRDPALPSWHLQGLSTWQPPGRHGCQEALRSLSASRIPQGGTKASARMQGPILVSWLSCERDQPAPSGACVSSAVVPGKASTFGHAGSCSMSWRMPRCQQC